MQDVMVASTLATDNSTFCSIEISKVINRTEHVYSSTSPDDDSTEDRNAFSEGNAGLLSNISTSMIGLKFPAPVNKMRQERGVSEMEEGEPSGP
jgi:hypothetical protein